MPKVLVLTGRDGEDDRQYATDTADGAKSVRFAEVEIRTVAADGSDAGSLARKPLACAHQLRDFDAVIVVSAGTEASADLVALLDDLQRESHLHDLANTVFAVTGAHSAFLSERLGALGGIVVTAPAGQSEADARRSIGVRVAKLAEWIRHALSHERNHQHHHH